MAYYKTCPYCGANLDPSEHCDCSFDKVITNKEKALLCEPGSNTEESQ